MALSGRDRRPLAPTLVPIPMAQLRPLVIVPRDRVRAEVRQLRAEVERLQAGLRFYADPAGYTPEGVKTDGAAFGYDHPDRGAHARALLSAAARDA